MKCVKLLLQGVMILTTITFLYGCWYVAAAGAGAYGGYKAKEEGYTIQSPVKKESPAKKEDGKKKDETRNSTSEKK